MNDGGDVLCYRALTVSASAKTGGGGSARVDADSKIGNKIN